MSLIAVLGFAIPVSHHPKLDPHIRVDHGPVMYVCKHVGICWRDSSQGSLQIFGCFRLQMDADICMKHAMPYYTAVKFSSA